MNLLLLPEEIEDLLITSMFNVVHRPKMQLVMNELLVKHKEYINTYEHCANCNIYYLDETYSTYILFSKYKFCSEWCRYDTESDLRKSYRRSLKRLQK